MSKMEFTVSPEPTVGVEIELALVDERTMALTNGCPDILSKLPESSLVRVKPELMQCYIEGNSDKFHTVEEAGADLRSKFEEVERVTDDLGMRLFWSGSHPFSLWQDQQVTENARYHNLVDLLQDTARQLVTFGLHVHVGVDSGDKAVMICDRILRHLPTLLALSANSPFWDGRETGLSSWRSRIMDGLPTAGLPPLMRNWSEYVWLVTHLVDTGFIETIREIWWDVRPHHNFGTVEIRICDVPGSLDDAMAIAGLIHSLVVYLSDEIDEGTYQHDCHPMMIRQNKWRASRYGLEAELVDSNTYEMLPARDAVRRMVDILRPTGDRLNCGRLLDRAMTLCDKPSWAQRQLTLFEETGSAAEMVRRLTDKSRLTPRLA